MQKSTSTLHGLSSAKIPIETGIRRLLPHNVQRVARNGSLACGLPDSRLIVREQRR